MIYIDIKLPFGVVKCTNCSIENNKFMNNSNFIYAYCFGINYQIIFENVIFHSNFLDDCSSLILTNQCYDIQIISIYVGSNSFTDYSFLYNFYKSANLVHTKGFFENNFLDSTQSGLIYFDNDEVTSIYFSGLKIIGNSFESIFFQIFCDPYVIITILDTIIAFNNNDENIFSSLSERSQNIIFLAGYFSLNLTSSFFANNICFTGPCLLILYPYNEFSSGSISKANFSNNIAYYASIIQMVSCIISVQGAMSKIEIENVIMRNNSISFYAFDDEQEEFVGPGSPCLFQGKKTLTLFISNSNFVGNKGSGYSSCLYFFGMSIQIFNTSFEGQISPLSDHYQISTLSVDCFFTLLNKVTISGGKGGSFSLGDNHSPSILSITDILIYDNLGFFSFIEIKVQNYWIVVDKLRFISNVCYYGTSFLALYNAFPETSQINITDSFFIDNICYNGSSSIFLFNTIALSFHVIRSLFNNNSAYGKTAKGCIMMANCELSTILSFSQSIFTSNSAPNGDIFILYIAIIFFEDCLFAKNQLFLSLSKHLINNYFIKNVL